MAKKTKNLLLKSKRGSGDILSDSEFNFSETVQDLKIPLFSPKQSNLRVSKQSANSTSKYNTQPGMNYFKARI